MPDRARLRLQRLEDRLAPATWGNAWPDASHLTFSFGTDGTAVGDQTNSLFATLDAIAPRAVWQREALRAFQTWAANANINIAVVGDGGQPFGSTGSPQSDDRFGDIRLAAYPTGSAEHAYASPFDPVAGTWSGDVTLDSNASFDIGSTSKLDLYSVLLHEAGHVFGLDHSSNQASPMYENYLGIRTGLISEDVSRLEAIYGVREPDTYEGSNGNNTLNTATSLNMTQNSDGSYTAIVAGELSSNQDKDCFSFTTDLLGGSVYIRLTTAGLSLLTPQVSLLDGLGNVISTQAASDPASGDLIIAVNSLDLFGHYTVRVEGANNDVFGIGSYQLKVQKFPLLSVLTSNLLNTLNSLVDPLVSLTPIADAHTNEAPATATQMNQQSSQADGLFDANYLGVISDTTDRDFYKVMAPSGSTTLTALAWAVPGPNQLTPRVSVFNADGDPVMSNQLVIDTATSVIQVTNITPGAVYYVQVQASTQPGAGTTGNYLIGVDFALQASSLDSYCTATLNSDKSVLAADVEIARTSLFHFVLSVEPLSGPDATAWFIIRDAQNQLVYYTKTNTAEPISGRVMLRPGHYVAAIVARPLPNANLAPIRVRLRGAVLDDPIGPQPVDPTESPSGDPPPEDSDPTITWTGRDSSNNWDNGADEPYAMA